MVTNAFFVRAAVRSEIGMSRIRAALAVLLLVRVLAFDLDGLGTLTAKPLISLGGALIGLAGSLLVLERLAKLGEDGRRWLAFGVSLDSIAFAVAFAPVAIWPSAGYAGFLRSADASFLLVATAASGIRLDKRLALFSASLNGALAAGFLLVDRAVRFEGLLFDVTDLAIWALMFSGAVATALAIASRTRRLVVNAVEAQADASRARERLGAYVSPEIAREVLEARDLRVGGERKEVAILFSDLRGFTRRSEMLPPEQIVSELNAYLDVMVRAIRAHGGVIDKFVGDAIMAVFGAFDDPSTAARRAIAAARAMQDALVTHNADRAKRGLPPLEHGIGVHHGAVVAGNVGNADRIQYTVIGDTVNAAARLESATKEVGVPVLVSREAAIAAGAAVVRIGALQVKGRTRPLEVFTVPEALEGALEEPVEVTPLPAPRIALPS